MVSGGSLETEYDMLTPYMNHVFKTFGFRDARFEICNSTWEEGSITRSIENVKQFAPKWELNLEGKINYIPF